MPIRPRISAAYSSELREFERLRRDGPLPKSPDKKPPASEREPLLAAIATIPLHENMPYSKWNRRVCLPLMSKVFTLWGIELALYPCARAEPNDSKTPTGVLIMGLTPTKKNVRPTIKFTGEFKGGAYRRLLDWLEDNYYGG